MFVGKNFAVEVVVAGKGSPTPSLSIVMCLAPPFFYWHKNNNVKTLIHMCAMEWISYHFNLRISYILEEFGCIVQVMSIYQ